MVRQRAPRTLKRWSKCSRVSTLWRLATRAAGRGDYQPVGPASGCPAQRTVRGWRRRGHWRKPWSTRSAAAGRATNPDIATIQWLEHEVPATKAALFSSRTIARFCRNLRPASWRLIAAASSTGPATTPTTQLKEQALKEEETRNALFDKRLAQEENWIRQGIKARRTRNEGRVRALKAMRDERASALPSRARPRYKLHPAKNLYKLLSAPSYGCSGQTLLSNFKLKIMRGDRVGIIGKTTAWAKPLCASAGPAAPDLGSVKIGTNLTIGYFDQVRDGRSG